MNDLTNKEKFKIFLGITKKLNNEFGIVPILFGSLGLYRIIDLDKKTGDIDVLINDEYVQEKWPELLSFMKGLGYTLQDEHEHEFMKDDQEIAFAKQSNLLEMNNIYPAKLEVTKVGVVQFRELSTEQYLTCYETVYNDEYRRKKNHNADAEKIKSIKEYLGNAN